MTTDTDLELPRRLRHAFGGRFGEARVLGTGPHGTVLRAHDAVYGEVAVKVLTAHAPDFVEAGALSVQRASDALDHPRIVHVLEVLRDGGLVAIVTPYLSGGNLESRMTARDEMPWERIQALVTEIADILDAAHAQHIVHGGVNPNNVVFDAQGRAFLRDFGTTQTFAGWTRDSSAEAYAAPEWWRGNHLSPRSDQYSLAVIALELITRRRRTDAPGVEGIQVLEPIEIPATAQLRPGLALSANRALAQALAASPNNRFASAGEFAAALGAVSYRSPVAVERKQNVSWRAVQVGAVAAALLVATAVAIDAGRRNDTRRSLGAIERGTRGLADQLDAVADGAGNVATPDMPKQVGDGASDAADRVAAGAPTPRVGLPGVPGSARGAVPTAGDARNAASARASAASAASGRLLDSLSIRTTRTAPAAGGTPGAAMAGGLARATEGLAGRADTARARAGQGVANAAAAARTGTSTRSEGGEPSGSARANTSNGLPGSTTGYSSGSGTTGGQRSGSGTSGALPSSSGNSAGSATGSGTGSGTSGAQRASGNTGGSGGEASPAGAAAAGATPSLIGFISVSSDQARTVIVDGVPRGSTPTVVRVTPGNHSVSAAGVAARGVNVVAGDTVSVRLAP